MANIYEIDEALRDLAKAEIHVSIRCHGSDLCVRYRNNRFRYHITSWGWITRTKALEMLEGAWRCDVESRLLPALNQLTAGI